MSRFRSGSGWASKRSATIFAAGFCLFGLLLGGAPRVANGVGPGSGGSQQGITLAPGLDSKASCATYPCATVTVSGSGQARISLSLGIDSDDAIQPETYYTDLVKVANPTGAAITITSVALSGITASSPNDFGTITLYYCQAQTDTPGTGCEGSYTAGSQAGGFAFQGGDVLPPGASRYLEFSGYAGTGSHPGDTITFLIEVASG